MQSKVLPPKLSLSGQPSRKEIEALSEYGFQSLINLRRSDEDEQRLNPEEERLLAEEAGLHYHNLPIDPETLDEETVDRFRRILAETPQPVLVHCRNGMRAGALVMMHIGVENGQRGDEVWQQAEEMGYQCDSRKLKPFVIGYIDAHTGPSADVASE